jgi:drug/metabolite transporter (DMT)-like permease
MLAWLILGEAPVANEILGGIIILAGVFVVLTGNPMRIKG